MDKLKFNKVFAFDIDGTLLHRDMQKVAGVPHDFSSNGRYIYLRPNLHHLIYHLPKLKLHARFVLWTSMLRKNAQKISKYLAEKNLSFDGLYCQEHCRQDLAKDLRVVAEAEGIDVTHVYLIDDSPHKRIEEQNFIHISNYDGTKPDDNEILRVTR